MIVLAAALCRLCDHELYSAGGLDVGSVVMSPPPFIGWIPRESRFCWTFAPARVIKTALRSVTQVVPRHPADTLDVLRFLRRLGVAVPWAAPSQPWRLP